MNDKKFVHAYYLGKSLPPIGTETEYGKIESYNSNNSINIGNIILDTITGNSYEDTLEINSIKLLDCNENKLWINK